MENKENIIKLINNLIKENINDTIDEKIEIDNAIFYKDTNALMIASNFGFNDIVNELIEKGIDINSKDINGKSAIMFAIENNKIDTINILINNNADINIQDKKGITPIMWASGNGKIEAVKLLLNKNILKLYNY